MSVRKRTWTTSKGESKEAWIVDYADQNGERHIQTFSRKKEADEFHATVNVDVRQGTHTPQNKSITVAEAAEDWIAFVKGENRERSTIDQYRAHVKYHINPRIGRGRSSREPVPRPGQEGAHQPQGVAEGCEAPWQRGARRVDQQRQARQAEAQSWC